MRMAMRDLLCEQCKEVGANIERFLHTTRNRALRLLFALAPQKHFKEAGLRRCIVCKRHNPLTLQVTVSSRPTNLSYMGKRPTCTDRLDFGVSHMADALVGASKGKKVS